MRTLDRYLVREFAQAAFATLVILLMVSVGAVFAKVLADIASGRVPAGMMLAQLGLQMIRYLPLILPLGLMLGMLLAVGRLYRDAEMPVLTSIGIGPRRLLRPVLWVAMPVILLVALCSLWLGPLAKRTSQKMVESANRNLLVAGLEPGRFIEVPGGGGVIYVGAMSGDGTRMNRVFVYRQQGDRLDVTTARSGGLDVDDASGERFLTLDDGFRVEGPREGDGRDYRLMRYASNELRVTGQQEKRSDSDPESMTLSELAALPGREGGAELNARIAPPLLALAFVLLAVPLARSPPRQARYGRVLMGVLAYVVGMDLMLLGTDWLAKGKVPMPLGLWWLVLPLLAFGAWMYLADGRMRRPRLRKAAAA